MKTASTQITNESAIRTVIDQRINAVRNKDVDAAIANAAADVVLCDVADPLQRKGLDGARARAEEWFASFDGPIDFSVVYLTVAAGDEVGFCHRLAHVNATQSTGDKLDMYWRVTLCLRKF